MHSIGPPWKHVASHADSVWQRLWERWLIPCFEINIQQVQQVAFPSHLVAFSPPKRGKIKKTHIHRSRRKRNLMCSSSQCQPVFQKFYASLKHELNWTYGELLLHTSLDFTGYKENVGTTFPNGPSDSKPRASREQMTAVMQHFFWRGWQIPTCPDYIKLDEVPLCQLQPESTEMFSTTPPYTMIKPVRNCTLAPQQVDVRRKLLRNTNP